MTSDATPEIGDEEWRSVVNADPELKWEGAATVVTPNGGELVYKNPLLTLWLGHPHSSAVCFDFRSGAVVVKNPGAVTLKKLSELASLLGACVQGDEGEIYDVDELQRT